MKKLIALAIVATATVTFAAKTGYKFRSAVERADSLGWTEEQKWELVQLQNAAEAANDALDEFCKTNGLYKAPMKAASNTPEVDPTIEAIKAQAKKYKTRYETIKKTQYQPSTKTNVVVKAGRASAQEKITTARAERDVAKAERDAAKAERDVAKAERDAAKAEAQVTKDIQKKAKKASKNLSKVIQTLEKARDKSSDEDEASLYQSIIDLLNSSEE